MAPLDRERAQEGADSSLGACLEEDPEKWRDLHPEAALVTVTGHLASIVLSSRSMATTSNDSPPGRRYHSPITGAGLVMAQPLRCAVRVSSVRLDPLVVLRNDEFK